MVISENFCREEPINQQQQISESGKKKFSSPKKMTVTTFTSPFKSASYQMAEAPAV